MFKVLTYLEALNLQAMLGRSIDRKVLLWAFLLGLLVMNSLTTKVTAHYAPIDDGGSRRDSDDRRWGRHDWDGWRREWDDRWIHNRDSRWAPPDNDRYVERVYRPEIENLQKDTTMMQTEASAPPSIPDIPNFHKVDQWLFRGGQPTEAGLYQLYQMGVRTIIDLRSDPEQIESERQICQQHGLNFISLPLTKDVLPTSQAVCRFVDVVESAHRMPDKGVVFVHCHLGSDRTGCMVALYRQLMEQYPFQRAYDEMLSFGFDPSFTTLKKAVEGASQYRQAVAKEQGSNMLGQPVNSRRGED